MKKKEEDMGDKKSKKTDKENLQSNFSKKDNAKVGIKSKRKMV